MLQVFRKVVQLERRSIERQVILKMLQFQTKPAILMKPCCSHHACLGVDTRAAFLQYCIAHFAMGGGGREIHYTYSHEWVLATAWAGVGVAFALILFSEVSVCGSSRLFRGRGSLLCATKARRQTNAHSAHSVFAHKRWIFFAG